MTKLLGRNDPCHCGSGKKFKKCCGISEAPAATAADSHEGAVERALAWLAQYHRKGFAYAMQQAMDELIMDCLDVDPDDEDAVQEAMASINDELWNQLQINLTEWMLAEGEIQVKGQWQRVPELLLGASGPLLSVGQRNWLAQLAKSPLRLYEVTSVMPGTGVTVCDALDVDSAPIVVIERTGSRTIQVGMQLGARVMTEADGHHFSGALYPFSMFSGRATQDDLRAYLAEPKQHPQDQVIGLGLMIIEGWLRQYLQPAPLPTLIHNHTGEPLLFTTDHYQVLSWPTLQAALAAQTDVQGDAEQGWDRLLDCDDGQTRPLAKISSTSGGRRVAVMYQTTGLREQGRLWFEALAADSVKFLTQDVSDPKGMLANADPAKASEQSGSDLPAGMDPAEMAAAFESVIKCTYDNWADDPLPALNNKTPRQAIQSAAGLARVKGLLHMYEDGELKTAAEQGRSQISFQFLWDELGLQR